MIKIIKTIASYIVPYRLYVFLREKNRKFQQKNARQPELTEKEKAIGACWDNQTLAHQKNDIKISNWWESDFAKRSINILVNNVDSPVQSDGLNYKLLERLNGKSLKQGVSVGCGSANKELRLLQMNVVEKFLLFELSEERINIARQNAEKLNLADRVEIRRENAFEHDFRKKKIDFVHWNNSLHHMLDVEAAVRWSKAILSGGGVFYMDDYVGSTRFQYPKYVLDIVNEVRDSLPDKYKKDLYQDGIIHGHVENINPDELERGDPSEAADSERILKSVRECFPNAEVILTGGIIYFIALTGLWGNFDEESEEDISVLTKLMELDKKYAQNKDIMSPYAVALDFIQ